MRYSRLRIDDSLTRWPGKRRLYALDTYFREGWFLLEQHADLVQKTALVVFKPDALVGRRIRPAIRFLESARFRCSAFWRFTYDRLLIRETWRYQFNIATTDRIEVVDLLLPATPSVLVLLEDLDWEPTALPGSVRLTALKGPAQPASRREGQLRRELGTLNTLFNFVHSADEPIDVVRELGLICDRSSRSRLLSAMESGRTVASSLDALLQELESMYPAHDLDFPSALKRLSSVADERLRNLVDEVASGAPGRWRALLERAELIVDPRPDIWDLLTVATNCIECDLPGLRPILPAVSSEQWGRSAESETDTGARGSS